MSITLNLEVLLNVTNSLYEYISTQAIKRTSRAANKLE